MRIVLATFILMFLAACSRGGPPAPIPEDAPSPAVIERGRVIYQANCATCHGGKGEGESPNWKTRNADNTYPAPPHDSSGHTWHHSDQLLFEIVKDGGGRYNSPAFKSRMLAWGDKLSDDEIRAVLAYIKGMWGPTESEAQREATRLSEQPR